MKKYKIKFTKDYLEYEEWAKKGSEFGKSQIEMYPEKLEHCRKWAGKEITIMELEDLVKEVGEVIFDGLTIEVYNDYRE